MSWIAYNCQNVFFLIDHFIVGFDSHFEISWVWCIRTYSLNTRTTLSHLTRERQKINYTLLCWVQWILVGWLVSYCSSSICHVFVFAGTPLHTSKKGRCQIEEKQFMLLMLISYYTWTKRLSDVSRHHCIERPWFILIETRSSAYVACLCNNWWLGPCYVNTAWWVISNHLITISGWHLSWGV